MGRADCGPQSEGRGWGPGAYRRRGGAVVSPGTSWAPTRIFLGRDDGYMTRLIMRVRADEPMCSCGTRMDVARGSPEGASSPSKPVTEKSTGTRMPIFPRSWTSWYAWWSAAHTQAVTPDSRMFDATASAACQGDRWGPPAWTLWAQSRFDLRP